MTASDMPNILREKRLLEKVLRGFAKVDITAHSSLEYDFSKASATKEKGTLCENLWGKILTHFQSTWQEISPLLLFIIHEAFRLSLLQNWLGSSKVYSCVRKTSRRKLWTILGLERMTKRIIFPTRDDDNANGKQKRNLVAIASSSILKIDFKNQQKSREWDRRVFISLILVPGS